jgi:hypothetical protein
MDGFNGEEISQKIERIHIMTHFGACAVKLKRLSQSIAVAAEKLTSQ